MNAYSKFFGHLKENPKNLFLIDSIGALLTVVLLMVITQYLNEYFAVPDLIIPVLTSLGILLFTFSFVCFLLVKTKWPLYITLVAIGNTLYCIITFGMLLVFFKQLSAIGVAYFLIEMIVVVWLIYTEIKLATVLQKRIL